jgi:hypothetical protein
MPYSTKLSPNSSVVQRTIATESEGAAATALIAGDCRSGCASVVKVSTWLVVGPLLLRSLEETL